MSNYPEIWSNSRFQRWRHHKSGGSGRRGLDHGNQSGKCRNRNFNKSYRQHHGSYQRGAVSSQNRARNPASSASHSGVAQSNSSSSSSALDLPGFYYDPEKKRYFRLLPGNNNFNPLTNEKVKESASQKDKSTRRPLHSISLLDIFRNLQLGITTSFPHNNPSVTVMASRLADLRFSSKFEFDCMPDYNTQECTYLVGCPENNFIVSSWELENGGAALQAGFLSALPSNGDACPKLNMHGCELLNIHPNQKINDVCIADVSSNLKFVLYSTVSSHCERETFSCVHLQPVRCLCGDTSEALEMRDRLSQCLEFSKEVVWSCTWNKTTKNIAFGLENRAMLKHIERSECRSLFTNKEKPYSATFNSNGTVICFGTHKGNLLCLDLRENCSEKVSYSIDLGRGISYIRTLSNDAVMITSGYDGKLLQVDLQQRRPILSYEGHQNDSRKIPFSLDEEANVLCCTGKDKRTRLWSLKEGQLLSDRSLLSDTSVDSGSSYPWTWFSSHWGGDTVGQMAIVMAARQSTLCTFE